MEPGSKEFFERVRFLVLEGERTARVAALMRSREGLRGASIGASRGGAADPLAAVDGRLDFEGRAALAQAEREAHVAAALRLLYGDSGRDGLWATSPGMADTVALRYVRALSWKEVEAATGMSRSGCVSACSAAFEKMDHLGARRTALGIGDAEG